MSAELRELCEEYMNVSFELEDLAHECNLNGGEEDEDLYEMDAASESTDAKIYDRINELLDLRESLMQRMHEAGLLEDQLHALLQEMDEIRYGSEL